MKILIVVNVQVKNGSSDLPGHEAGFMPAAWLCCEGRSIVHLQECDLSRCCQPGALIREVYKTIQVVDPHHGKSPVFVNVMATGLNLAGTRDVAQPELLPSTASVTVKSKSTTSPTVELHPDSEQRLETILGDDAVVDVLLLQGLTLISYRYSSAGRGEAAWDRWC